MWNEIQNLDLTKLAFDIALGYNEEEDVCLQYNVTPATLEALRLNPEFRKAVIVAEREITEAGTEFKLKARKLSSLVLDELSTIALSEYATHNDRINAIKELTKLAGYAKEDSAPGTAFQVNINL